MQGEDSLLHSAPFAIGKSAEGKRVRGRTSLSGRDCPAGMAGLNGAAAP